MISYKFKETGYTNDPNYMTSFYYDAFAGELAMIWGKTQFMNEIQEMCFHKSLSNFLRDNYIGEESRRQLLYYYMKPYFKSELATNTINALYRVLPTSNLYLKRALNNLCVLYDEPPDIEVTGANEDEVMKLIQKSNLINLFQKTYRLMKLHNRVLIRPKVSIKNGKKSIDYLYYTPDKYRFKYDSLGNQEELWLNWIDTKDGLQINKFWVWDKTTLKVLDNEGKQVPFSMYQNGKAIEVMSWQHPFGEIPYLERYLNQFNDYEMETDGGGLWELLKAQLDCNFFDTIVKEQTVFQGFPIRFLGNWNLTNLDQLGANSIVEKNDIYANEMSPIPPFTDELGSDTTFETIDAMKKGWVKDALKQLGLPSSLIEDTTQVASGAALKELRRELDEARLEDMNILQEQDKDLINLLIKVANLDPASDYRGKFSDNYEIKIEYADFQTYTDFALLQVEVDYLKTSGLISPKEYVNKLTYKNIKTDEEAIKLIQDNKELFKQLGGQDDTTNGLGTVPNEQPSGTATEANSQQQEAGKIDATNTNGSIGVKENDEGEI